VTTHQSTSLHVEDANGENVAFSTVDGEARSYANHTDKPVLRVWRTAFLPDGQPTELEVLFTDADVRDLRAFLTDTFGIRGAAREEYGPSKGQAVAPLLPWDHPDADPAADVLAMKQHYAATYGIPASEVAVRPLTVHPDVELPGMWEQSDFSGGEADSQHLIARQCPVIYSGVQCAQAVHPDSVMHHFPGYSIPPSQNDAGAVPPPADAQGAANALQPAGTGQPAAVSATNTAPASTTHSGTPLPDLGPLPEEPKKRKRRTKLEIAYDEAKKLYDEDPNKDAEGNTGTLTAWHAAREALRAKDPGNTRLNEQALAAEFQEAQAAYQASGQVLIDAANAEGYNVPHFAPEPLQPGAQPVPGQVYAPDANGGIPAQAFAFTPPPFNPEQAAAQAFPCPATADDGRPCQRPYGHEIQTDLNPDPKPHVFAANMDQLREQGIQNGVLPVQQYPAIGYAPTGVPAALPQDNYDAHVLNFQVPPTPPAAPVIPAGADLQPPAPTAPFWQQPQGGQ
jgi:hypothetical protein